MNHLEHSINSFAKSATSQEEKGIQKYGKPLNPLDNYDWLEMAKEEQVDGFKYLEAEKVKRNYIAQEIRGIIAFYMHDLDPYHFGKLSELLNQLEGKSCK